MINLSNKFNGFSSTMKNISKIKNDEYMTNSQYEVYNFDKIKEDFSLTSKWLDVESNHIFPLHKYILTNILMKGDVLPMDYRAIT